jgi:ELMO domain-containing protein
VIKPAWDTFTSSISGIWKGVGAVFSPFTAEMEPISVNNKRENLYDCYTLSRIEKASENEVKRTINWVTLNPFGEGSGAHNGVPDVVGSPLPSYESFDLKKSELLEEDAMFMEPGLVFFEVFFMP